MSESKRQLSRFTAIFAAGTLLSRVLGLIRDMVVGSLIPAVSLDAFLVAFKLPNMLRDMLGEGATNAAFVPVLAESGEKDSEEQYRGLVGGLMSAMLLVFAGLTLVGVLLMPLFPAALDMLRPLTGAPPKDLAQLGVTVRLLQWTFPYLFLIGMAVFAMAPLFVAKRYGVSGWSPMLLNLALIGSCLLLRDQFADPAWALVVGVWLGGIAQLIAMYASLWKETGILLPNFRIFQPGVGKAFLLLAPIIAGQATGEVNKLVDSFFAYSLEEGTVTSLFYANRLVQLPLSIFGIAVAVAILPSISRAGARGEDDAVRETLMHGMRQSFFLIAPAMAGLLLLREPIVRLLFERGAFDASITDRASTALLYYGLGLLSFAWVRIIVQGFYAVQNTKTPVIIASTCMFLNILLNCALVGPLGFRGLALSTSISFTLNFALLYALLGNRFGPLWDRDFLAGLSRMVLAVLIMGAVVYGIELRAEMHLGNETFLARFMLVALPVTAGALVYGVVCWALRMPELRQFTSVLRREK